MTDHPRVECLVPYCRRGTRRHTSISDGSFWIEHDGAALEWICDRHWRSVPPAMKGRRRKLLRLFDQHWVLSQCGADRLHVRKTWRARHLAMRHWARIKIYAVETAMGL